MQTSVKILIGILSFVILAAILPVFFKFLRFDFINGGGYGPSSSASKEESIERGVYVCDVMFVRCQYKNGKEVDLRVKEAWIEKLWRGGTWYWTTKLIDNAGYSIELRTSLSSDEEEKLHITNNKLSALGDYEGLGCCCGGCKGSLKELPANDTIRYNLLKKDNLDFSEENIIGELVLVVKKP
jgi:hypothetical protein